MQVDQPNMGVRLAADIGGTFTDVVLETPSQRYTTKILTTPRAPELGVLEGIRVLLSESGTAPSSVSLFIHGTTLATNSLIERKGARTALLTTEGFRDILEMGYEKRFDVNDINIEMPPALVPRQWRYVARERVAADGSVLSDLDEDAVRAAGRRMLADGIEAVAIGFLQAWAYPDHERRAREILGEIFKGTATICISSEVCPEIREYERFSTTVANAYVRPQMASYLQRLQEGVLQAGLDCPLLLMMSGGGLCTVEQASRFPIRLVESGPAGGAIFAAHLARECGLDKVMAFDMGGTTAKVCLISGSEPERARRFEVGRAWKNLKGSGLPLRIPVIELVEIGAGGGSIGRIDAMQRITVGPDSCGSEPGPACYGRGGKEAAVTDANVELGRIDPEMFAGGTVKLDVDLARQALQRMGNPIGMDASWTAAGMSEIVEENMANAARVHAIEKGQDLAGYTMIAFGGGAPLHAGRLAQKLGIRRLVVPSGAGVGSAIGFLRAPVSFEVVRTELNLISRLDPKVVSGRLSDMYEEAYAVVRPALSGQPLHVLQIAEMRYAGQGHELRIPLSSPPAQGLDREFLTKLAAQFEEAYEKVYGMRVPGCEVEVVTWLVTVATQPSNVSRSSFVPAKRLRQPGRRKRVWEPTVGAWKDFGVHDRAGVTENERILGPALLVEKETTVVVPEGWTAQMNGRSHLILEAMNEQ